MTTRKHAILGITLAVGTVLIGIGMMVVLFIAVSQNRSEDFILWSVLPGILVMIVFDYYAKINLDKAGIRLELR